jgi:hypothetical protein
MHSPMIRAADLVLQQFRKVDLARRQLRRADQM